ncbi:hypothetical protein SARC_05538 [Sphaeroforma arctica JP610]|uniref:Uncharacterized protein n=1 Tax=Sphaeroforma arctica JP610 TaxID=667725 RepID=A0A0L0FZA4_9EUKA|nr:hypothetical protein SARC_05538 [Sphaeroforma arctica JP610]KNC82157.1 hypothetical protein SARC_05538 [Sphaeroforma arctica JP610]|eukprot:XP_014156059.1 hypothetical protein SARC_05538 [Sphaeroforma arctica JP610]
MSQNISTSPSNRNENDVVLSDNAMFIYQNAKSVDKQLQYIDGGRHDLHACSQLIRQHVMNTLYSWVAERSGESAEEVHHRLAAVSSFRLGTPVGLSTSAGVKSAACNETNANSASGLEDVIESDSASIGHEDLTRSLEIKSGSEGTTVESADHPRGLLSETEGDGDAQAAIEGDAVDAGVMLSGLEERRALEGDTAPLQNAPVLPTDERSLSESDEVLIGDGEKSLCAGNDDEASPAKIRMHKQMSQPLSKQYLNNCSSAATEGDDIIGDSGRRRSNSRRHSCADFSDTTTMVSINFDVNDWFSENADAEAARENGAGKTKKANVLRHASTQGDAQVGTGRRKHASFGVRMSDAANLGMSKDGVVLVFADESGIRYSRDTTVENTVAEAQQIYKHSDDAEHELAANSGSGT